jgi:hypothetical protein
MISSRPTVRDTQMIGVSDPIWMLYGIVRARAGPRPGRDASVWVSRTHASLLLFRLRLSSCVNRACIHFLILIAAPRTPAAVTVVLISS